MATTSTPELSQLTALSNDFTEETLEPPNNHRDDASNWYTSLLLEVDPTAANHHRQQLAGAAGSMTSSTSVSLMSSACDDDLGQIVYDASTPPVNVNWSSSETSLMGDHTEATASSSLWAPGQPIFMSSTEKVLHNINASCSIDGLQDVLSYSHEQDLKTSDHDVTNPNRNYLWDDHQFTGSDAKCNNYLVDDDNNRSNNHDNHNDSHETADQHQHHLSQQDWPSASSNVMGYQQSQNLKTLFHASSPSTYNWLHAAAAHPHAVSNNHVGGLLSNHRDYWSPAGNVNPTLPQCGHTILPVMGETGVAGNRIMQAKDVQRLAGMRNNPVNLVRREILLRNQHNMLMNGQLKQPDHRMVKNLLHSQQQSIINNIQRNPNATVIDHQDINADHTANSDSKRSIISRNTFVETNNNNNHDTNPAYNNPNTLKRPRTEQSTGAPPVKQPARKEKLGDRITVLQQLVSPFGKTDTASVLLEAIGYIKFLQEQVQLLSSPYMKNGTGSNNAVAAVKETTSGSSASSSGVSSDAKSDLRSRGLCLVPLSYTLHVVNDFNATDCWTPPYNSSSLLR